MNIYKRIALALFASVVFFTSHAQNKDPLDFSPAPKKIEEVIGQLGADTIVFYYNDSWQLVRPICATICRLSKIDEKLATFAGGFTDYYLADTTKAVEGNFYNGKKEGLFKVYFANGQLSQTGYYINDKKSGIWEYFFKNGNKKQVLDFQGDDILVKDFWSEDGEHLVVSGNGKWFDYDSGEGFFKINGEIVNGKKNGTWKRQIESNGFDVNIEKYKDGKLLSGKFVSMMGGRESYTDTVYCKLEQQPRFITAESFILSPCYFNKISKWEEPKYPGGSAAFYREIKNRLRIRNPEGSKGIMRIRVTIDEKGKMIKFDPLSNTGNEFNLIRVLETMNTWTPAKLDGKPTSSEKVVTLEVR